VTNCTLQSANCTLEKSDAADEEREEQKGNESTYLLVGGEANAAATPTAHLPLNHAPASRTRLSNRGFTTVFSSNLPQAHLPG
jgi:hypothetical protein